MPPLAPFLLRCVALTLPAFALLTIAPPEFASPEFASPEFAPSSADSGQAGPASEPFTLYYVAPDGKTSNPGTLEQPLSFGAAIERLRNERIAAELRAGNSADGLAGNSADGFAGGAAIVLLGGTYPFTEPYVLDQAFRGRAEAPIVIQAAPGAKVVFDGAPALRATDFAPVTAAQDRARLAASAVDAVRVMTIESPAIIERLRRELVLGISWDGVNYFPARFPNEGYAQLAEEAVIDEISPPAVPVGKQAYGVRAGHPPYQEHGRKQGWLGSLTEPRGAHARFADRGDEMAGSWQQWQDELARDNRRNRLTGFLDANWLQKSQPLVSANAETQSVQLSQALAYGWAWKNKDKPFHVFGMLCELDAPGEWYFDPTDNRLFVYPPTPIQASTQVRVPVAPGFLHLQGTQHVRVQGLNVQNVASGVIYDIDGGNHNQISGASISNSTATGIRITGQHQRVLACDLFDLNRHISLAGGRRGPGVLEPGDNLVENCHIYQDRYAHQRVGVSISGVGNQFRHNLVHNSLGQAVTIRGNDHLLEFNELFNIGFDEGDGGAMYAGGDLSGYGVTYRYNFFHHLMHVPGKVERSGIHLDDLQAGAICVGNVFYKSAGKGIFMNGGAGHTMIGNVFLAGYRGLYNVGHGAQKNHDRQLAALDPQDDYHNTKENYVGRVERAIGPQGWNQEPWASTHPLFAQVMNDAGQFGRMWPIRCTVRDNWFYDNEQGDATIWSRVAPEAAAKSTIEGDRLLDPSIFVNYAKLDLRIRPGAENAPSLPFEKIGLYRGKGRRDMPGKSDYRAAIRAHFDGIRSMPGTNKRYNSAAAMRKP